LERVPHGRHDEQVAVAPLPGVVTGAEPHPATQHVDGRVTRALVLGHGRAGRETDERLAKDVLMPAVHGLGRTVVTVRPRAVDLLPGQCVERQLLHGATLSRRMHRGNPGARPTTGPRHPAGTGPDA